MLRTNRTINKRQVADECFGMCSFWRTSRPWPLHMSRCPLRDSSSTRPPTLLAKVRPGRRGAVVWMPRLLVNTATAITPSPMSRGTGHVPGTLRFLVTHMSAELKTVMTLDASSSVNRKLRVTAWLATTEEKKLFLWLKRACLHTDTFKPHTQKTSTNIIVLIKRLSIRVNGFEKKRNFQHPTAFHCIVWENRENSGCIEMT